MKRKFSRSQLRELFTNGIECYRENHYTDIYCICLQAVTSHLEFEGSMHLLFKKNDTTLFTLSFTFLPGQLYNYHDANIIYVSSIQGTKDQFDNIRMATRYFNDNALPFILLKTLEAIAFNLHIDKCLGVSAKNQLSFKDDLTHRRFYSSYDVFWKSIAGTIVNEDYLIGFPLCQKPILQISQHHRNRTLKKRKKLQEIFDATVNNIGQLLHNI